MSQAGTPETPVTPTRTRRITAAAAAAAAAATDFSYPTNPSLAPSPPVLQTPSPAFFMADAATIASADLKEKATAEAHKARKT